MKKILFSDYDGTFYKDEANIVKNVDRVKKFRAAGNIFCLATGRSYSEVIEVINKYNIEYDYLIVNDGLGLIDDKGNILHKVVFEENLKKAIYYEINQHYLTN